MHKLHLPRLGQTMEQGTILTWLKHEDESFAVGEPLYEVSTEKVNAEVEAKLPGTLARITAREGEELPVGALLAIVADPGETLTDAQIRHAIAADTGEIVDYEPQEEAPVPAPPPPTPARIRAMPRARALAEQMGIDLAKVSGTGSSGTITVEDVQRTAASEPSTAPAPAAASAPPAVVTELRIRESRRLHGIPRTMADVVTRSWQQVPQFVQIVMADVSGLRTRRQNEAEAIKRSHDVSLSIMDLVLEAVVKAAREVPEANASFKEDSIIIYEDVNLSVAAATDAGLVVPVIHRAQELALGDLAVQLRRITERARAGALTPQDMEGGTITVSNLGRFGIETGTPLVTIPQAVIVFTGAILDRPVAVDGLLGIRPTMYISVGFDHRVLDGATAARFTAALKHALEA